MNKISISMLQELFSKLPNYNEETIKISIVVNFLKLAGFKEESLCYEYPTFSNKRRVDITVYVDKNVVLFVEVKNGLNKLTLDDQTQLANYMNDKNISWGILTNGRCYILMNNNINGNSSQKEVLRYYLIEPSKHKLNNYPYYKKWNDNNLNYFSFNSLFETRVTNYYKHWIELKNYIESYASPNNKFSWSQYKSVLYNFFDYLSKEYQNYDLTTFIRPYHFNQFLLHDINEKKNSKTRCPNSKDTIISKYAYIKALCEMLKATKQIPNNPFEKISMEEMFKDFTFENSCKDFSPLKEEEIQALLDSYDNTRYSQRNKLILLLFIYLGLDIQKVKNLKDSDIDLKNKTISVNNKFIPLFGNIFILIENIINYKKTNNILCPYLIYSKFNKSYNQLADSYFNKIITLQYSKLEISKTRNNKLTTSFIRSSLISQLYNKGVRIEEIANFMDLSLESIKEYLYLNNLKHINLNNDIVKKHPYKNFL